MRHLHLQNLEFPCTIFMIYIYIYIYYKAFNSVPFSLYCILLGPSSWTKWIIAITRILILVVKMEYMKGTSYYCLFLTVKMSPNLRKSVTKYARMYMPWPTIVDKHDCTIRGKTRRSDRLNGCLTVPTSSYITDKRDRWGIGKVVFWANCRLKVHIEGISLLKI